MASCKLCNRSGLFLSVNKNGLCNSCAPIVYIEADSRLRVINDSIRLVNSSKNLETRLTRCDLIVEKAQALAEYENKGIFICNPAASQLIDEFSKRKITIIQETMKEEAHKAVEKSKLGTTLNTRLTPLTKFALLVGDYRRKFSQDKQLEFLESGIKKSIHEIQLQSFLDDAHKYEFKSDKKKALDRYYEALYFLKHDEIEDTLQAGVINELEGKIRELSGQDAIIDIKIGKSEKGNLSCPKVKAQPTGTIDTGNDAGLKLSFDLKNPKAVAYIKEHGAKLIVGLDDETSSQVQNILAQAVDEGWAYKRTAEVITNHFAEITYDQAEQIAITEIGNAYCESNLITAQELQNAGIVQEKAWSTVGDNSVCEFCRRNEETGWIPLNQPFPSGHQRPLAHSRCRCTMKTRRKK